MRTGANLLHRVPRPESAGRKDGRVRPHRTPGGEPARHLPRLRPLIYRRINLEKIDVVRGELEITFTHPASRIDDRVGAE